jgi:TetR/AcrR family transcriptional repressor of mexJK operon
VTSPGKEKTKQLILEAAQKHFAHYGFSKVTMDEIADQVGLGKASLYYYFPTKEKLFESVVAREKQEFMDSMTLMARDNIPAPAKLRSYVRHRFEHFNKLMNLNIFDLRSSSKMKPMMKPMFDEFAERELKILRQIILEGKKNNDFNVTSAEKVAEAFLHTMKGLRLCRVRASEGPVIDGREIADLEQELELVTDIFLQGICKDAFRPSAN